MTFEICYRGVECGKVFRHGGMAIVPCHCCSYFLLAFGCCSLQVSDILGLVLFHLNMWNVGRFAWVRYTCVVVGAMVPIEKKRFVLSRR